MSMWPNGIPLRRYGLHPHRPRRWLVENAYQLKNEIRHPDFAVTARAALLPSLMPGRQFIVWHRPNPLPEAIAARKEVVRDLMRRFRFDRTRFYIVDQPASVAEVLHLARGYFHNRGYLNEFLWQEMKTLVPTAWDIARQDFGYTPHRLTIEFRHNSFENHPYFHIDNGGFLRLLTTYIGGQTEYALGQDLLPNLNPAPHAPIMVPFHGSPIIHRGYHHDLAKGWMQGARHRVPLSAFAPRFQMIINLSKIGHE